MNTPCLRRSSSPRPPFRPSGPPVYARACTLQKATSEISKHKATNRTCGVLRARNGPQVFVVHQAPFGRHVLVYRPASDHWDGPFALLREDGEDFTVIMKHGTSKFRSTSVKRYIAAETDPARSTSDSITTPVHQSNNTQTHASPLAQPPS